MDAEPDHVLANRVRAAVNVARAKQETSLMAKGIFTDAANASLQAIGEDEQSLYKGSRVGIGS